jgi:hypothetical protein
MQHQTLILGVTRVQRDCIHTHRFTIVRQTTPICYSVQWHRHRRAQEPVATQRVSHTTTTTRTRYAEPG